MEVLERKYDNFRKCCEALGKMIELQEKLHYISVDDPAVNDLFKAGVIKHFELAYETAWKFLKEYLAHVYQHEASSPKSVFRACETYRIFSQHIATELIMLADTRNTTTHIYDQVLAREVCNSIFEHYRIFKVILETIQMPLE